MSNELKSIELKLLQTQMRRLRVAVLTLSGAFVFVVATGATLSINGPVKTTALHLAVPGSSTTEVLDAKTLKMILQRPVFSPPVFSKPVGNVSGSMTWGGIELSPANESKLKLKVELRSNGRPIFISLVGDDTTSAIYCPMGANVTLNLMRAVNDGRPRQIGSILLSSNKIPLTLNGISAGGDFTLSPTTVQFIDDSPPAGEKCTYTLQYQTAQKTPSVRLIQNTRMAAWQL